MLDIMWHEARKQERKIRGMLVDYKRRAERRREYYEKIKQDPTQFIQLHGRPVRIHLDPAVASAAEAPGSMMPWRGDADSMIDRFDVRAHLDTLPPPSVTSPKLTAEEDWEERQANYERYRILIQNDFLGIKEEKFLHQIRLEEQFGPIVNKAIEEEKKALAPKKAAIAFTYTEDTESDDKEKPDSSSADAAMPEGGEEAAGDGSDEESDSDIDLDLTVDVMSLSNTQQQEMNTSGVEYGLNQDDFMSLISRDLQEAEELRVAKEHEDEKAMYSGRKSRKERRALKKKHMDRKFSPPSYAARASPTYAPYRRSSSRSKSRSPTPPGAGTIKFITSFGGESDGAGSDDDGVTGVIILPKGDRSVRDRRKNRWDQKNREGSGAGHRSGSSGPSSSHHATASSHSFSKKRRHLSRSRSRSRSRSSSRSHRRHRSRRSHSRSRSYTRHSRYTRSRSRSHSRSRSRDRHSSWRRSRGPLRHSHSHSKSHSRSKSLGKKTPSPPPKTPASTLTTSAQPLSVGEPLEPPAKLPSPPCRRYYGRRGKESNSESASESEAEDVSTSNTNTTQNSTNTTVKTNILVPPATVGNGSAAAKDGPKLTPQERLKKKTQALLKKQFKADKRLERERAEKAEQERQDREEELREMAIRLRRREREKRHQLQGEDSSSDGSRSRSGSASRSGGSRSRSRSKSRPRSKSRQRSRSCQRSSSRSKSPFPPKQAPTGRWAEGMRGRERNASSEWGREGHSRQWSSSHWESHPPPDRHRESYRRRSRSYSPPGRWEREHHSSNRSRSRSRGRDYTYNNSSNTASSSGGGFRRKSFRDYERERDWDCPDRDAPQRNEVFRDYQHGYQRDYQHGYQRDYQHRNFHHKEGREREGPPQDFRDRHQRDHPRDGSRPTTRQQQQSHGYSEEREDGGRIGRIRLVDY